MEERLNYLYGAAVQGIQSFIFQTNELKDIVGASELVEQICTKAFDEFATDKDGKSKGEFILKAAGNIKFIFEKKVDCENAVLNFPKKVMEMAPGITISQAVVSYQSDIAGNEDKAFEKAVDELERRLRVQRNKPMQSTTLGLMGIKRAPKTGLPGMYYETNKKGKKEELIDEATSQKRDFTKEIKENKVRKLCHKSFNIKYENLTDCMIAYDIEDITDKNDWIAIIHADGNGLGQVVQKVGKNKEQFKQFSDELDNATINAAHTAYEAVKESFKDKKRIPLRPVVLGGDDMTIICRADIAVAYADAYIQAFETETENRLSKILKDNDVFNGQYKLTCCAGIAFIKSSYPFYYGYNLAETLCDRAKKDAKETKRLENHGGLAPSCLMFHKVQDSFVESFDDIESRELTPAKGYSFAFGPYYNYDEEGRWTIAKLISYIDLFKSEGDDGNAAKTNLRQWLTTMYVDPETAKQRARRTLSLMKKESQLYHLFKEVTNTDDEAKCFPVYDMLSLYTVINQETK
jgi:hypothetical protein